MAWKPGPLPPDTYGWGAVVPTGTDTGFYFADFCGDRVNLIGTDRTAVPPEDVRLYDNSITLPENCFGRAT